MTGQQVYRLPSDVLLAVEAGDALEAAWKRALAAPLSRQAAVPYGVLLKAARRHAQLEALGRLAKRERDGGPSPDQIEFMLLGGAAGRHWAEKMIRKDTVGPVYLRRPLLNGPDLVAWAKANGFESTLPAEDLHVTIAFSRDPVSWEAIGQEVATVEEEGGSRELESFGSGALVLTFDSTELEQRWQEVVDLGASWDWPDYRPHVTLTYNGDGVPDLADLEPYSGPLVFGPEIAEPLDDKWLDEIVEKMDSGSVHASIVNVPPAILFLKDYTEVERDPTGRWSGGGGGGDEGGAAEGGGGGGAAEGAAALTRPGASVKLTATKDRAWSGEPVALSSRPSKQEVGALGENCAVSYLRTEGGMADAHVLNSKVNNFPVDMIGDHELIEVKTGLASNSSSAQQWRATIGQPGASESAWLKTAGAEEKALWNADKAQAILDRKYAVVKDYSKKLGRAVKARTLTSIVDTDRGVVDLYLFDGFHSRIAWKSEAAKKAYVGSFKYE